MTLKKGIDVSFYQGDIDWNSVKKEGIYFTILRSTYGLSSVDTMFKENVKGASSAKIKIEGVYHFSYALTADDAKKEAEFAIKQVKEAGLSKDTIIFYDYEYDSVNYANNRGYFISSSSIIEFTKAFCDTIKKNGYKYGVYLNDDYYQNKYNKGKGLPDGAVVWIADWSINPNKTILGKATFYQYSSTGYVRGIKGEVDLNYYLKEDEPIETVKEEKSVVKKKEVTDEVVANVIAGDYGNGEDRKKKLESEGYDYREVQNAVNKALTPGHKSVSPAKEFDRSLTGKYVVTATALNLRYVPGVMSYNNIEKILYKDEIIQCWGYFTTVDKAIWLLIQNGNYTGFIDSKFVKKI